jgi:sodium/hydrogen exchanger-like protein 6/7/sodium/hydrogen exchanger 8
MADEAENETITALFTILIMVLLGVFFVAQTYVELKQPPFGHETGVVIILGILASYIVLQVTENHNEATLEKLQFSQETFFFFILPPIIFASGYNMRRKKFFSNLGTIMIFGLVATLVCFSIYTGMTLWVLNKYTFNQSNGTDTKPIKLESFDVMSFCALMCASDVIAAISLISYKQQPKLFSVIYGEGVFNDIVGIIIFDAVFSLKKSGNFDSSTPFEIIGKFFLLAFTSIIIGVVFAVLCSLLLKHVRILTHSAIVETILLYLFASIGYFISEATANSSIISMLVAGILMAHYTFFNLSPQGKTVTSVTF